MKKVLLALTLIALLSTSVFAWDVIGGRIGIGAQNLDLDEGEGDEPFITYDPYSIPALQFRLTVSSITDRDYQEDQSVVALAALYRLGEGDIVPHLGLEIGAETYRDISNPDRDYNLQTGSIILGAEWKIFDRASLTFDLPIIDASTKNTQSGKYIDKVTNIFGVQHSRELNIGFLIYLD